MPANTSLACWQFNSLVISPFLSVFSHSRLNPSFRIMFLFYMNSQSALHTTLTLTIAKIFIAEITSLLRRRFTRFVQASLWLKDCLWACDVYVDYQNLWASSDHYIFEGTTQWPLGRFHIVQAPKKLLFQKSCWKFFDSELSNWERNIPAVSRKGGWSC